MSQSKKASALQDEIACIEKNLITSIHELSIQIKEKFIIVLNNKALFFIALILLYLFFHHFREKSFENQYRKYKKKYQTLHSENKKLKKQNLILSRCSL
jgi:hypothetical protein